MKLLSQFTPAETLVIRSGAVTPLKDLLKYTLMDLLLKQVLVIQEVERQPHLRDAVRTYTYVLAGKNFAGYVSRPHETVFLSPFQKDPTLLILFRNVVALGYQNAGSERKFYTTLVKGINQGKAFHTTFYQKLFGGFTFTKEGLVLKAKIEHELAELEKTVPAYIAQDKKRGLETLKLIGGNIFLLQGLDFELLKEIDRQLMEEMSRKRTEEGGCGAGCWVSFDLYSSHFDNSCSSGCSGDSGCSGCSGCGGCGGD